MSDRRWTSHVLLLEPPQKMHKKRAYEELPSEEAVRNYLRPYGKILGLHAHQFRTGWQAAFVTFYEPASLKLFLAEHPHHTHISFPPDPKDYDVLPLFPERLPQYVAPCRYKDIDQFSRDLDEKTTVSVPAPTLDTNSPSSVSGLKRKVSSFEGAPVEVSVAGPSLPRRPPSPMRLSPSRSKPSVLAVPSTSSPIDPMRLAELTSLRDEIADLQEKIAVEEEHIRRKRGKEAPNAAASSVGAGSSGNDELIRSLEVQARAERSKRKRLEEEERQLKRELEEIEERHERELERTDELERKLRRVQRQTRWRDTANKKASASPLVATLKAMVVDDNDEETANVAAFREEIEHATTDLAELDILLEKEEEARLGRVAELDRLRKVVAESSDSPEMELALSPVHLSLLDAFDQRVRKLPRGIPTVRSHN